MRLKLVPLITLLIVVSTARAGLTVTQIKATVETNGYAPLDGSQYLDEEIVENVSPAIASAAGDWIGTNVGGSTPTWHWIGAANVSAETTSTANSLLINANGTFSYDVTTTADFINPNTVELMYGPGSAAQYFSVFSIDAPAVFRLQGVLSRYSLIQLYSVSQSAYIYNKVNTSSQIFTADVSGTLTPGIYSVGANTSRGAGLPSGSIHEVVSGSFTNFNFTVSVPEPSLLGAAGLAGLFLRRRRRQ